MIKYNFETDSPLTDIAFTFKRKSAVWRNILIGGAGGGDGAVGNLSSISVVDSVWFTSTAVCSDD